MRGTRYARNRIRRTGMVILLLSLTMLLLVSCMAGSNVLWVKGLLGLDTADYLAEETERTLQTDGAAAKLLVEIVEILVCDNLSLKPFSGTSEAVELYRDVILNDMLRDNYALYTGNRAAIDAVAAAYPHTSATTLISASDFENTVFRYFGGTTVSHRNGELFSYLGQAGYYSSPLQPRDARATVSVLSLEETEHTWRMQFCLEGDGETSEVYLAMFVKRTDGTSYWKALQRV